MIIRPYVPADAGATLGVFLRAVRVTAARDYTPDQVAAWAPEHIDAAQWAARRAAAGTVVAVADSGVVGFSDIDASGHIDMMFVDPAAARTGVASALLRHVLAAARARGTAAATTRASVTARPFFEAHGFTVVRRCRPVIRGVALANFAMRLPLAAES